MKEEPPPGRTSWGRLLLGCLSWNQCGAWEEGGGRREGEEVAADTASGRQVSSFSSPVTSSALENVNTEKVGQCE